MNKKSKSKALTLKEKKLIKAKIEGKTHYDAGIEAGYKGNYNTISSKVSTTLRKEKVISSIQEALINQGLTNELLCKKLAEGLEAKKILPFSNVEVIDYSNRHKYLETALKVNQTLEANQPIQFNDLKININIIGNKEETEAIECEVKE